LAASLLLIVTAYFSLTHHNPGSSHQYASYEYQDPGLPILMSQSSNYLLSDALTYFGEQDYETTITKLLQIEPPVSDTVSYYLAASYYYDKQDGKAIAKLKNLAVDKASIFNEKAEWLLVLSYLHSADEQSAVKILDSISANPEHQFYEQSLSLRKVLSDK